MSFGTPFARPFGGGAPPWIEEVQALLDAYAPGWSDDESTQNYAEVRALALLVAIVWAVDKRAEGIRIPSRMLETLPTWEQACGLRPGSSDTVQARRAAVAARLIGFAGNAYSQIYDICAQIAGPQFIGLATVSGGAAISYVPGLNPGPPGFEWCSARARIAVQLSRTNLPDATWLDLVRRVRLELQILCPAWLTFVVGSLDGNYVGFIPSVSVVGCSLS